MKTSNRRPTGIDSETSTPEEAFGKRPNRSGNRRMLNRIIPVLMLTIFALLILRDQVPAVSDKIDSLLDPAAFSAVQLCRKAALSQSHTPEFARLVRGGKANTTSKGFFVDRLVIGEMDEQGGEQQVAVSCHIDQDGELVKLGRSPYKPEIIQPELFDEFGQE